MTMSDFLGKIAFIIGLLFAFFGGIWGGVSYPQNDAIVAILLLCGVIIAILNVTAKEAPTVLAATVAMVILGIWAYTPAAWPVEHLSTAIWENTAGIVVCFAILMVPASLIIAIRAVIATAQRD